MPDAFLHPHTPLDTARPIPSGARTASLYTWERLETYLRAAGAVRPSETIKSFVVSSDGLYLVMEKN